MQQAPLFIGLKHLERRKVVDSELIYLSIALMNQMFLR